MTQVLIVQNITREGPGLLARVLDRAGIAYDLVDLDKGETFPDPRGYKALVVLGGPDSANDDTDKMRAELAQVEVALDAGMPYLGICLGLQVLVKAVGGQVVPGAEKEIGLTDAAGKSYAVEPTAEGGADSLLAGLPPVLDVFQLHGETVELTPGMELLATGEHCRNQIVRVADRAYGIQSHFELTPDMLAVWAAQDPDLQPIGAEVLAAGFERIRENYTRIGESLLTNFLHIAGLL
ncbi:MAG TPA: type 1 glutamine amidotransferase [Candidatus Saccharimonadales bacterium]|jgi:GMP synthase-like glutamine amidotransferase